MLIMFRVKNFASFKDETILDMRAVSYKNMKEHVIELPSNKVVKTLSIFGKNASGKSNLVSAMYYFESFVYNQFLNDGYREDELRNEAKMPNVRRTTFQLSEVMNDEIEFEIIFYHDGKTYQYGFILRDLPKENKYMIQEEWLYFEENLVFERNNKEISFGKNYKKELKNLNQIIQDRLYLGFLDFFAAGKVKKIVEGIKEYLEHHFNVHFELIFEGTVKGAVSNIIFSDRLVKDKEYRNIVEQYIKVADIGITGLQIEKKGSENIGERSPYDIKTIHPVYDEKGSVIREERFDFSMESSGTIRYFSFIQYILDIFDKGGVFVVDEMTARIHPLLTKFIIDLFQGEKNKKAQLIFTSHDMTLMNSKQFRRDEIAFVEKNEKGESSLYTLADIKVREDARFAKDYLSGKYGAIPMIKETDFLEEMAGK